MQPVNHSARTRSPGRVMFAAFICCASLSGCGESGAATAPDVSPPTNLDVFGALVRELGNEMLNQSLESPGSPFPEGDTVVLSIDSAEGAWLVRSEIGGLLIGRNMTVIGADHAGFARSSIRIFAPEFAVKYTDAGDADLFSSRSIKRSVRSAFTAEVSADGRLVLSRRFEREKDDLVIEDDVEALQNQGEPFTVGVLPPTGAIDRLVEPLIIIGAVGTVIFLFFNIRS